MATDDSTATRTTGHLDLTMMLAFHDAFRRDLAHLARAASRHGAVALSDHPSGCLHSAT